MVLDYISPFLAESSLAVWSSVSSRFDNGILYLNADIAYAVACCPGTQAMYDLGAACVFSLDDPPAASRFTSNTHPPNEVLNVCIVINSLLSDASDAIVEVLKKLPCKSSVTVLSTVSSDAHASSSRTTLEADAYDYILSIWEDALSGHDSPQHKLAVQYFPLHVKAVGGAGFNLMLSDAAAKAIEREILASTTNDVTFFRQNLGSGEHDDGGYTNELEALAHDIAGLKANLSIRPSIFAAGPLGEKVAQILHGLPGWPQPLPGTSTQAAALVLIDRAKDLPTAMFVPRTLAGLAGAKLASTVSSSKAGSVATTWWDAAAGREDGFAAAEMALQDALSNMEIDSVIREDLHLGAGYRTGELKSVNPVTARATRQFMKHQDVAQSSLCQYDVLPMAALQNLPLDAASFTRHFIEMTESSCDGIQAPQHSMVLASVRALVIGFAAIFRQGSGSGHMDAIDAFLSMYGARINDALAKAIDSAAYAANSTTAGYIDRLKMDLHSPAAPTLEAAKAVQGVAVGEAGTSALSRGEFYCHSMSIHGSDVDGDGNGSTVPSSYGEMLDQSMSYFHDCAARPVAESSEWNQGRWGLPDNNLSRAGRDAADGWASDGWSEAGGWVAAPEPLENRSEKPFVHITGPVEDGTFSDAAPIAQAPEKILAATSVNSPAVGTMPEGGAAAVSAAAEAPKKVVKKKIVKRIVKKVVKRKVRSSAQPSITGDDTRSGDAEMCDPASLDPIQLPGQGLSDIKAMRDETITNFQQNASQHASPTNPPCTADASSTLALDRTAMHRFGPQAPVHSKISDDNPLGGALQQRQQGMMPSESHNRAAASMRTATPTHCTADAVRESGTGHKIMDANAAKGATAASMHASKALLQSLEASTGTWEPLEIGTMDHPRPDSKLVRDSCGSSCSVPAVDAGCSGSLHVTGVPMLYPIRLYQEIVHQSAALHNDLGLRYPGVAMECEQDDFPIPAERRDGQLVQQTADCGQEVVDTERNQQSNGGQRGDHRHGRGVQDATDTGTELSMVGDADAQHAPQAAVDSTEWLPVVVSGAVVACSEDKHCTGGREGLNCTELADAGVHGQNAIAAIATPVSATASQVGPASQDANALIAPDFGWEDGCQEWGNDDWGLPGSLWQEEEDWTGKESHRNDDSGASRRLQDEGVHRGWADRAAAATDGNSWPGAWFVRGLESIASKVEAAVMSPAAGEEISGVNDAPPKPTLAQSGHVESWGSEQWEGWGSQLSATQRSLRLAREMGSTASLPAANPEGMQVLSESSHMAGVAEEIDEGDSQACGEHKMCRGHTAQSDEQLQLLREGFTRHIGTGADEQSAENVLAGSWVSGLDILPGDGSLGTKQPATLAVVAEDQELVASGGLVDSPALAVPNAAVVAEVSAGGVQHAEKCWGDSWSDATTLGTHADMGMLTEDASIMTAGPDAASLSMDPVDAAGASPGSSPSGSGVRMQSGFVQAGPNEPGTQCLSALAVHMHDAEASYADAAASSVCGTAEEASRPNWSLDSTLGTDALASGTPAEEPAVGSSPLGAASQGTGVLASVAQSTRVRSVDLKQVGKELGWSIASTGGSAAGREAGGASVHVVPERIASPRRRLQEVIPEDVIGTRELRDAAQGLLEAGWGDGWSDAATLGTQAELEAAALPTGADVANVVDVGVDLQIVDEEGETVAWGTSWGEGQGVTQVLSPPASDGAAAIELAESASKGPEHGSGDWNGWGGWGDDVEMHEASSVKSIPVPQNEASPSAKAFAQGLVRVACRCARGAGPPGGTVNAIIQSAKGEVKEIDSSGVSHVKGAVGNMLSHGLGALGIGSTDPLLQDFSRIVLFVLGDVTMEEVAIVSQATQNCGPVEVVFGGVNLTSQNSLAALVMNSV